MLYHRAIFSILVAVFCFPPSSFAEMRGQIFVLSPHEVDSAGSSQTGTTFQLLDSVGQPTAIGSSSGTGFQAGAGFIYGTQSTMAMDQALANTTQGLNDILANLAPRTPEARKIRKAIKRVAAASTAYDLYFTSDPQDLNALKKALKKTKQAINNLIASGVADTLVYQEMMARAAELTVKAEIDKKALIAVGGEANRRIIKARVFYGNGLAELDAAAYNTALKFFQRALNKAIAA